MPIPHLRLCTTMQPGRPLLYCDSDHDAIGESALPTTDLGRDDPGPCWAAPPADGPYQPGRATGMQGSSSAETAWVAAARQHGWLTGPDAQTTACDATIIPYRHRPPRPCRARPHGGCLPRRPRAHQQPGRLIEVNTGFIVQVSWIVEASGMSRRTAMRSASSV